jgi:hypothetical protein
MEFSDLFCGLPYRCSGLITAHAAIQISDNISGKHVTSQDYSFPSLFYEKLTCPTICAEFLTAFRIATNLRIL